MAHVISGVHHIQLAAPAGSESAARRFYGDVIGMREIPKPANLRNRGGVWFECGAGQLHIGIQDNFIPAQKAHPAFYVIELHALREHLIQHHVKVVEDEPLPGFNRFYVSDPFGNRLEFLERHHE